MTERVHVFGSHRGLVGIVTEPSAESRKRDAPAVVFSNVGLNHRVGPGRVYVELARKLAASGFVAFRFDLSGFGDSNPRSGTATDLERATLDTREALDFLEGKGITQFVLVGFCSGVDSAHAVAVDDARVVGAVFIDGYAYKNFGFWLRYFTIRILQPARWGRYIRQRFGSLRHGIGRRETGGVQEVFDREYPSRLQFAADVDRLVQRSVQLLFVYTVVADNHYNYQRQFHDTFGHRGPIEVEYYRHADHVFSVEAQRRQLRSRLVEWMEARFPERAGSAETSPTVSLARPSAEV